MTTSSPLYQRAAGVRATEVDGEYFLVPPGSEDVFYLDQITSGLWRLLGTATSEADLIKTYREAFPDAPPDSVEADVPRALADLQKNRLIELV